MSREGWLRLYEASTLTLSRTPSPKKRELVAKQRPADWAPPSMFRPPEVLTEAEVVEAEAGPCGFTPWRWSIPKQNRRIDADHFGPPIDDGWKARS